MLILRSNEPHVILHIHKRSFTTRTQPKSRQKYIVKNDNNKATQPWITQCRSTLVLPSPRYACPRPVPACLVVTYPSLSCVINSHSMSIHCLIHTTCWSSSHTLCLAKASWAPRPPSPRPLSPARSRTRSVSTLTQKTDPPYAFWLQVV